MTLLGILAVYAAVFAFIALLRKNPGWWLSQHLFSQWGPRTGVPCMTRRELFGEGLRFLLLGALCAAIFVTLAWLLDRLGVAESPGAMVVTMLAFILSAMGFLAAAYLFVRGLFRSRRYVPPPDCGKRRQRVGLMITGKPEPGSSRELPEDVLRRLLAGAERPTGEEGVHALYRWMGRLRLAGLVHLDRC